MSVVRPFPARVVRPDRAPDVVIPLADSLEESRTGWAPRQVDPAAYDESAAALYVYRQHRGGLSHTGVVCEVAVQAFLGGQVRGHEAVDQRRVEALVEHHRTTAAQPALVSLVHRAGTAFSRVIEETCRTPALLDFTGPGGGRQTVWRVPDGPAADGVADELSVSEHYIADGHHRVAAALEEWRERDTPPGSGLLCVIHALDELRVSAFHRQLAGPVDPVALLSLLGTDFLVHEVSDPPTPVRGAFGLYVDRGWFVVTRQGSRGAGLQSLDVSALESWVRTRLDPHTSGQLLDVRPAELAPVRAPIEELIRRCDAEGGALFTLAPPSLDALTGLATSGEVMPPKTTYFEPKPCAGIFLRPGPLR